MNKQQHLGLVERVATTFLLANVAVVAWYSDARILALVALVVAIAIVIKGGRLVGFNS